MAEPTQVQEAPGYPLRAPGLLGRQVLLLQLSSSKEACQEACPQDESAKHSCALLPPARPPLPPACSLPLARSFRKAESWGGKKLFAQTAPGK